MSTITDIELEPESEDRKVAKWRCDVMEKAGYPHEAAEELSLRSDVDLHDAVDLLLHGCEVTTAIDILL